MQILVHIQVPEDGRELFNAYEDHVLPLLKKHSGELIARHISQSGEEEFHILQFKDKASFENYLADPDRVATQPLWEQSDATSRIITLQ